MHAIDAATILFERGKSLDTSFGDCYAFQISEGALPFGAMRIILKSADPDLVAG